MEGRGEREGGRELEGRLQKGLKTSRSTSWPLRTKEPGTFYDKNLECTANNGNNIIKNIRKNVLCKRCLYTLELVILSPMCTCICTVCNTCMQYVYLSHITVLNGTFSWCQSKTTNQLLFFIHEGLQRFCPSVCLFTYIFFFIHCAYYLYILSFKLQ